MNLFTKQTVAGGGAGQLDMYILPYSSWMTTKDLVYSTGNTAQCYVAAWMGEEVWGE